MFQFTFKSLPYLNIEDPYGPKYQSLCGKVVTQPYYTKHVECLSELHPQEQLYLETQNKILTDNKEFITLRLQQDLDNLLKFL